MFSFDETLPTFKDRVRAVLGDTNIASPLRSDEAISATLGLFAGAANPVMDAVGFLALSLANEYRTRPDSIAISGDISLSWRDRVAGWDKLARDIRAGLVTSGAVGATSASWGAVVDMTADIYEPATVVG